MKKMMAWIIIFLFLNNGCVKSPHALTFENVKKEYKEGRFKTIDMPSGKVFYMKDIFDLPENKQKEAWKNFMKSALKNRNSIMKKEGKILQAGGDTISGEKKHTSKYSEYIRTKEEIKELIEASLKKSLQRYKRECRRGVTYYCLQLAGNYYRGVSFKKNYKKSRFYFNKACQQNSGVGCLYLAEMYYRGRGGTRSRNKGIKLYKKACKLNDHRACFVLGKIYLYDKSIKRNVKMANIYLRKSCRHNNKDACKLIIK